MADLINNPQFRPSRHNAPRRPKSSPKDARKFEELLLYLARRSEGDPLFGAVKLNKLLFYSDFLAYARLGRPITNQRYQRLKNGPAPRRLLPVRNQLISNHAAALQQVRAPGGVYLQDRLVALRDANLKVFTGEEIGLVNEIIEHCLPHSGTDLSEATHRFIGWMAVEDSEDIPYEMVFVHVRELTVAEDAFARSLKVPVEFAVN